MLPLFLPRIEYFPLPFQCCCFFFKFFYSHRISIFITFLNILCAFVDLLFWFAFVALVFNSMKNVRSWSAWFFHLFFIHFVCYFCVRWPNMMVFILFYNKIWVSFLINTIRIEFLYIWGPNGAFFDPLRSS